MIASTKSVHVKEKQVSDLADKIRAAKTLMIVSIGGLPSKQFHSIKKTIREYADVKVAKKNIMTRAIKNVGKEKSSALELQEHISADCALVISDLDGYELAGILYQKKTPSYAKAGQIAPGEIEVKAGPTDLVPGPAISELGAFGIQVAVEDGKISIKGDKVIATEGTPITTEMASLLQKLNIQPFSVGLTPKVVFDVQDEKIYTELKIDPEGYTEELKSAAGKALGFAQKIAYYCKDTISYLLAKANAEGTKLEGLVPKEEDKKEETSKNPLEEKEAETSSEDKPAEEKKEETNEEKLENNAEEKKNE
jgi:large subunit ribosomal protein L10